MRRRVSTASRTSVLRSGRPSISHTSRSGQGSQRSLRRQPLLIFSVRRPTRGSRTSRCRGPGRRRRRCSSTFLRLGARASRRRVNARTRGPPWRRGRRSTFRRHHVPGRIGHVESTTCRIGGALRGPAGSNWIPTHLPSFARRAARHLVGLPKGRTLLGSSGRWWSILHGLGCSCLQGGRPTCTTIHGRTHCVGAAPIGQGPF
mmetsp:Transcript_28946/g.76362  ORF Transcript_28946/g.76362 Transcript_28946/m.76362 type:complete len:203 (+) Transcript_28946:491-1099(+)